jgi:hypothetical protein
MGDITGILATIRTGDHKAALRMVMELNRPLTRTEIRKITDAAHTAGILDEVRELTEEL